MKTEKLVRITAKSECMDIQVVMTSKKATAYVKKLNRIQKTWIDSISQKREETYGKWWEKKTRLVKFVPPGTDQKISIRIEPAGEILN
jgi:hypothetical protein